MRVEAIKTLGALGVTDPKVIESLLAILSSKEKDLSEAAAQALGNIGHSIPKVTDTLLTTLLSDRRKLKIASIVALKKLANANDVNVANALSKTLTSFSKDLQNTSLEALVSMKSNDDKILMTALKRLVQNLHYLDGEVSSSTFVNIQKLIDGRPLPGYRWVPIRIRQTRLRRLYATFYWTILLIGIVIVALGLSYFDAEERLMQVITVMGGLVGIAAGLAQVVGKALRNPWENRQQ